MQTDAQLVERARDDDHAAFGELYDRYADRLHTFIYSRLRNDADASDALQETFVNAHWRLHQLDDASRFRPWLFAIARNTIVDVARARGRHDSRRDWGPIAGRRGPTDPADLDVAADQPGPERGLVAAESASLLWDAAAALQPRDQELLELHLREGLDGSDLAEAMDVEPSHVYVMVKRMKDRLSAAVGSLLVARVGRDDCDELDALLADWDGRFSLAIRSTITRHVESCETCHATRRAAIAWESIAAAMPSAPAPAAVRVAVMTIVTGGVLTATSSSTAQAATAAASTPPTIDLTAGPEQGAGAGPSSGTPVGAGSGGALITTAAFVAMAALMTAAVVAWPVVRGSSAPDLVVTDVAGVAEQSVADEPEANTTDSDEGTGDGGAGDGGAGDGADAAGAGDGADEGGADLVAGAPSTTTTSTTVTPTPANTVPPTATPPVVAPPATTPTTAPATTEPPTTAPPTSVPATTAPPTTAPTTSSTTTTAPTTTSTTTSSTTTTAPTTTSTTTTTTTTLAPNPPVFLGGTDTIVFPPGVASVDYTFANIGDLPMSWAASTTGPFTVNLPKGTLLGNTSITLTITFDTTLPPDDYLGILDLNTDGGDFDIPLEVYSPPQIIGATFSVTTIYEGAPVCVVDPATYPTTSKLDVVVTDNGTVVSVTATWNPLGPTTTALDLAPGTTTWEGVIGPYAVGLPTSLDNVVVTATDEDGHTTSTVVALTIEPCPQ